MSIPHPHQFFDFSGQAAIVTGSGSGLGSGIAVRFAQAGAKVVVNYRSSAAGAEVVVGEIEASGGTAVSIQADVSQKEGARRLIAETVNHFGRLDVLINNAGLYPLSPLVDMAEAEWDLVMDSNLRSTFLCTQAAARQMIAQGSGGTIVNIASIEGESPAPMHSHYNAAKGAVLIYTAAAAQELGTHGIRINAVSPGLIWREGIEEAWPEGVERWQKAAPLKRLGLPNDVADACLFFASPAASWITGANLRVDGGVLTSQTY
ncbi:MAG: glucose 1-dehydrogenase [Chloroflexi bacterium]|jgi:NAD(P)-dependent dehydrogenase (short-subunit alcohol dehydrogenase family)|nr:glucose 1-dehydrogenase [Chloroflexota bacterium]